MTTNEIGVWFGRPIASQFWDDVVRWEKALNDWNNRLNWILELGTWQGGFSFYLYAQACARGIEFTTLDTNRPEKFVAGYVQWDVMNRLPEFVEQKYLDTPGVIFCDNGNKPEEVKLYVDRVHKETMFVVHDWGTEFQPKDIPDSLACFESSPHTIFLANRELLQRIGKPIYTF
jgi:hypothetical protein